MLPTLDVVRNQSLLEITHSKYVKLISFNKFTGLPERKDQMVKIDGKLIKPIQSERYYNPLALQIGTLVKVTHSSHLDYDDQENRILITHKFITPRILFICGVIKKAIEGKYHRGGGWDEDFEPATFTATKYAWFYEGRLSIKGKIILIQSKHITLYDDSI